MRKNIHQPQLSRTGNPTSAFSDRELETRRGGFGSGGGGRLSVTVKWSPPGRIPVASSPEASGVGYLFAVQKGTENSWFPNLLANLFNNLPKGVYRTLPPARHGIAGEWKTVAVVGFKLLPLGVSLVCLFVILMTALPVNHSNPEPRIRNKGEEKHKHAPRYFPSASDPLMGVPPRGTPLPPKFFFVLTAPPRCAVSSEGPFRSKPEAPPADSLIQLRRFSKACLCSGPHHEQESDSTHSIAPRPLSNR